jgi:bacillopeptidase F
MHAGRRLSGMVIAALLVLPVGSATAALTPRLAEVLARAAPDEAVAVIVRLADAAPLALPTAGDARTRRAGVVRALQQRTDASGAAVRALARAQAAERVVPLWIVNGIALTARAAVVRTLARHRDVASLDLDATFTIPPVVLGGAPAAGWNLEAIGAPALWSRGFTGTGLVIASMDTGVDGQHPDLAPRWRGGTNSWFDPNGEHATPYDDDGHGTQTMGLMVGGSAGGSAIGVAPGAAWIAVKIFDDAGVASASAIHQGFQWLLDPDSEPDTDDAPHIVNNSWGLMMDVNECIREFEPDVQLLRLAGIAVIVSAGNAGPDPMTSMSPGNYFASLAVGAIDASNAIASFSSRGPSACDAGLYPHLTAPGVSVRTSDLTFGGAFPDSYAVRSGTSFASPHVAGGMALLWQAFPTADVDALEAALEQSALDLGANGPDDSYGHGGLDLGAAYDLLVLTAPSTTTSTAPPTTTTSTTTSTSSTTTIGAALCGAVPAVGCRLAATSGAQLQIKDDGHDAKDRLKWKWGRGAATALADFGDPIGGEVRYEVCVYDASAAAQPRMASLIPARGTCAGRPCWRAAGGSALQYANKAATPGGIAKAKLKAGPPGKAQLRISGRGPNLATPSPPFVLPVTIQLLIDDGVRTGCWQTTYTSASANKPRRFKAKGP